MSTYQFTARLWVWPGETAWHFITVPKRESADIKSNVTVRRGFGSVKVNATIGRTAWKTSIFPDRRSGTYLLPVKALVRRGEGIEAEDTVTVVLKTTQ